MTLTSGGRSARLALLAGLGIGCLIPGWALSPAQAGVDPDSVSKLTASSEVRSGAAPHLRDARRVSRALAALELRTERRAAKAGTTETEVGMLAEAWYIASPTPEGVPGTDGSLLDLTCQLPSGCVANPVPVETLLPAGDQGLLMGAVGGRRLLQTYLLPDLGDVPAGATQVTGTLRLPLLDTADGGANLNPETAVFQACAVTGLVIDGVRAGVTGAPAYDCEAASAPAIYDSEDAQFIVDLSKILALYTPGDLSPGVALVPSDGDPTVVWEVSLEASGDDSGPRLDVSYRPPSPSVDPSEEPAPDGGGQEPESPSGTSQGGSAGVVPSSPDLGSLNSDPTEAAATGAGEITETPTLAPSPIALFNGDWKQQPGVIFLPLIFFAAIGLMGRAMTRPLPRRR